MRKKLIYVILILMIAVVAGCATGKAPAPPAAAAAEAGITTGKAAPRFTLSGLDGAPVAVPQADKVTVLNFWATWCPPCREEMPELQKFVQTNGANVAFYAINLREPAAKVTDFLQQNGYSMPVLLDNGDVGQTYRINAIPTTVVIDKNGIIKYRKTGPVTAVELEGVVKGL